MVIVKKSSPKNLSANCWSTVGRQLTDSLPTANQQVTNRVRKKENCGKHEQLTWCNIPIDDKVESMQRKVLAKCCYQMRIGYITYYNTPDI